MKCYPLQFGKRVNVAYSVPVSEAVCNVVSEPVHADGTLERLQERVDNLTELVARLTDALQHQLGPSKVADVLGGHFDVEKD